MPYEVTAPGIGTETHTNKDDVIIALVEVLLGNGIQAIVTWPDGFEHGVRPAE